MVDRHDQVFAIDFEFLLAAGHVQHHGLHVGLHDLVDKHMAAPDLGIVHNAKLRGPALIGGHIEHPRPQLFVIQS